LKKTNSKFKTHALRLEDFPGFSPKNLKDLEKYYQTQLRRHEAPEKKVGWKTLESQRVRFEMLTWIAPLKRAKVLDIGCGLGGFWGYLKEQEIPVRYTGIDLFPEVIQEAKKLHPDARFAARNILRHPYPARFFDYSFLSGVFNIKVQDNWAYMKAVLQQVLRQTKKAVAFNALNAESGLKESDRFLVLPKELVSFGRSLGVKKAHLMDHYHHLDLTLFLYK
jgi:SAM-dependent methyltransferase